jgi:hypothetical protein
MALSSCVILSEEIMLSDNKHNASHPGLASSPSRASTGDQFSFFDHPGLASSPSCSSTGDQISYFDGICERHYLNSGSPNSNSSNLLCPEESLAPFNTNHFSMTTGQTNTPDLNAHERPSGQCWRYFVGERQPQPTFSSWSRNL